MNAQIQVTWAFFFCPELRERSHMTNGKDKNGNPDVIMCTDDAGMQLYLSEKAANRLSWILTGVLILISMPVFILAFMSM